MRELGLDRISQDGANLIARDPNTGDEFTVPVDDRVMRLLAVANQRRRPSGPVTTDRAIQSSLTPREIQARIRHGESPTEVAAAAGVPVERIDGFAGPVLAERAYVAEQARGTTLRRKQIGGAPITLGSLIDEYISDFGGMPEDARWDAWRRQDGRWAVAVTPADSPAAHFLFDVKSHYIVPADEVAHSLVGEVAHPQESSHMELADAVLSGEEQAEAAPAAEADDEEQGEPAPVASLKEARDRRAMEQLAQASANQYSLTDQLGFEEVDEDEPVGLADDEDEASEQGRRRSSEGGRRHERRRVPSWDEIMFGGRDV
ncbi:MAG: septation protein SepH [Aeromicrobium sp.]|uniref:septation protein SepH n=1 Tax=Aeromicrobium sp. TaxID=1871063 RepID=UPI0039E6D7DD